MDDFLTAVMIVGMLFIGLPWLILHYVSKWKQAPTLTNEDEGLLDDMYNTARRLEERLHTIERIVAADNPDYLPRREETDTPRLEQAERSRETDYRASDYREPARVPGRNPSERI